MSALLWLHGGRHQKLLARKMKLGALLLSLNATTIGMSSCITTSCYDPPAENDIFLHNEQINPETDSLKCFVFGPFAENYSYQLTDNSGLEILKGALLSDDGIFDDSQETVTIDLPDTLANYPGTYKLNVYQCSIAEQSTGTYWRQLFFDIIDADAVPAI